MDRLDAMAAFVNVVDAGGFAPAARQMRRSAPWVTRAVALLESRTGAPLLRRTTRSVKLTEAGARYLVVCRDVLAALGEAERASATEQAAPQGVLTVTAPVAFGGLHVRPVVDALLDAHPAIRARLLLLDRVVSLVEEGIDVAIRIAHLPDSALVARKVGEVRRVVVASPAYLARTSRPRAPADLAAHACIAQAGGGNPEDRWTFDRDAPGARARQVTLVPRLAVNSAEAAIASAREGHGVTRVLSYQVERDLRAGRLVRLLEAFEPPPLPVHLVQASASGGSAKVRAFVELASRRLRTALGGPR
ncbi:MAG: Transcriptional regulator, LysR family [Labilithrix sp.]|nr:Transcriptional regulator, LysR family [Labilithrix sp.]